MSALGRVPAALLAAVLALVLASGCAKTVSTSSFSGEQRDVAKAISDLQSDVTASDEHKVCANDLARSLVTRLNRVEVKRKGKRVSPGCQDLLSDQLDQIDNFDMSVESVQVHGGRSQPSASARVRSIYGGKSRFATIYLVKEAGRWKISGAG